MNSEHSKAGARVRRVLLVLLAVAAVGGLVMIWMPEPIAVDTAQVRRAPLQTTVDEDGVTRVKDRYVVSAPLLGNLARIDLDAGDPVQPGSLLARLLPLAPPLLDTRSRAQAEGRVAAAAAARRQANAAVERVRTALEFATREAARQRGLTGTGAAAERAVERAELEERTLREDLASAEFGARVAEYELQVAQAALGRLERPRSSAADEAEVEITSPVGGRVLRVIQRSEGAVQPGTPLIEVGDPAALEIVVDVLTSDAVHIESGAPVSIERWGGPQALRAHVRLIEPSAFTRVSALGVEEQRVNVVIDLDDPHATWAALGDGYRVEARIVTWQAGDVLGVPSSALFRHGEHWAVFAVSDGRAHIRDVEIGAQNGQRAQITRGLGEGERVIEYPSDRVADGERVEMR
jgi:HlyD family secretion protein